MNDSWACLGPRALTGNMKNHEGTQFFVSVLEEADKHWQSLHLPIRIAIDCKLVGHASFPNTVYLLILELATRSFRIDQI